VPQVPFDGAWAKKELRADLRIGEALDGKPGDLRLLSCEVGPGLVDASSGCFAGCRKLAARALGERFHPDLSENVMCGAELVASVDSSALAPQPLTVEQVCARQLGPQPGAGEPRNRFLEETLGGFPLAQERFTSSSES
jgi:hypothetical protein